MPDNPLFLMAGGGTGGHVIPALAVARELRQRGHRVMFVGTDRGLEAKLVPVEGFELRKIEVGGLNRVGMWQKARTLAGLPLTTLSCSKLVRDASAVFSMGGYVAGPPVMAALAQRAIKQQPRFEIRTCNRVLNLCHTLSQVQPFALCFGWREQAGKPLP